MHQCERKKENFDFDISFRERVMLQWERRERGDTLISMRELKKEK